MEGESVIKVRVHHLSVKWNFFLFLCISIMLSGSVLATQISNLNTEKVRYAVSRQETTDRIAQNLQEEMSRLIQTGYSLFSSMWYEHLVNPGKIYQDDFSILRRLEISQNIADRVNSFEYINDILVIIPSYDQVISKSNWYSLESYYQIIRSIRIQSNNNVTSDEIDILSVKDNIYPLMLNDPMARYCKAKICILLDLTAYKKHCISMLSDGICGVSLFFSQDEIFSSGNIDDDYLVYEKSFLKFPGICFRCAFPRFENVYMNEKIKMIFLTQSILLFVSFAASNVLSKRFIKPIDRLLGHFSETKKMIKINEAFELIESYMKSLSTTNDMLKFENSQLSRSARAICESMHDEIMLNMVTSTDYNFQNKFLKNILPWIDEGLTFFMFTCICDGKEEQIEEIVACIDCTHHEHFHIFGLERCDIFWFKNAAQANEYVVKLKQKMQEPVLNGYSCVCSSVLSDLHDMRREYLALKNEMNKMAEISNELPVLVQFELLRLMREDKREDCRKMVDDLRWKYDPQTLMRFALRVAQEYNVDGNEAFEFFKKNQAEKRIDSCWNAVSNFLNDICRGITRTKRRGIEELAQTVKKIVDANFTNYEISRKLIANQLQVDGTIISKAFKAEFAIGFSDYLIEKRIEKACELLTTTDMPLATVAERVGYQNYLSFKRAFARVRGVMPREYRELYRNAED